MSLEPVLIAGEWRESEKTGTFQAANPASGDLLAPLYPISSWADCEAALESAHAAFLEMRAMPGEKIATFLEAFAVKIEEQADALVDLAHLETALPETPRLAGAELPPETRHPLSGESLLPILTGQAKRLERDALFWHFPGYMDTRQEPNTVANKRIGDKRYKLRYSYQTNRYELYDLSVDLSESRDLFTLEPSAETLAIAKELRASLVQWLAETKPATMKYRSNSKTVGLPPEL